MQQPQQTYRYSLAYESLLDVSVLHEYFGTGRCNDLEIRPSPQTVQKLRAYGLLFKAKNDGFMLAGNLGADRTSLVFRSPDLFDFNFRVTNPQFIRYTDLPYVSSQYHVFDTDQVCGDRLHPEAFVGQSTILESETDGIKGLIRIRHRPGHYLLPVEEEARPSFPRQYFIHFMNRKAFIKYIFYGPMEAVENFDFYFIENFDFNSNEHIFTSPNQVNLRNGELGFEITSKVELDMKDRWDDYWVIKNRKSEGTSFEYRKTLPLPRPENIVFNPSSLRYYAEIFVKL
jgi:hypothetical protein